MSRPYDDFVYDANVLRMLFEDVTTLAVNHAWYSIREVLLHLS